MALTTGTYNSSFRYDLATKQITFTDTTDYVAQGALDTDVTIVIKVESAISGIIYNNTNHGDPDINPDVSRDSLKVVQLPLDLSGGVEQGLYTVTLQYKDTGASPVTINEVKTFTLDYSSPTVDISMTVDCFTPVLSATDATGYTVNTVTPTIVRAFDINYPLSMNLPPVSGTASVVQTSTFFYVTGKEIEHSSSLVSTLSYDFTNGWYVEDSVTGQEFIGVSCPADLCDIYCCLRSLWLRYSDQKNTNTVQANKTLGIFNEAMSLSELVGLSIKCGKSDQATEYVTEILRISDCDSGCSCDDGSPQLVTGLGVNGNDVIVEAGIGVSVSSVTGGSTTTYTVALSSDNVTKLANMTNTIVTAGTNTIVNSTTATVGGISTVTYIVAAIDTVVQSLFSRIKMTINTAAVPVFTIVNQKKYGSAFDEINQDPGTEFITNENESTFDDWNTSLTSLVAANFGSVGVNFYPEVDIVNIESTSAFRIALGKMRFKAFIKDIDNDTFTITFLDEVGNPVNGLALQESFSEVELIFKIQG